MCFHTEKKEKLPFEKWTNDTLYHLIVTIYNRIHNQLYISLLEKYVEWYKKQGVNVFILPTKENVFPLENLINVLQFVKKNPDFRDTKNIDIVFSLLFKDVPNIDNFKKDYQEFTKDICKEKHQESQEQKHQEKHLYKNRYFTTSVYITSIVIVSSIVYYVL